VADVRRGIDVINRGGDVGGHDGIIMSISCFDLLKKFVTTSMVSQCLFVISYTNPLYIFR
jgi:hypothetical protein